MALIDHPEKWIVKMFKFHQRESGEENAFYYEQGGRPDYIQLLEGELVYGEFQAEGIQYLFTPLRLVILVEQDQTNLFWKAIVRCNGSFRSSHERIKVETRQGRITIIHIAAFPYRLQQLFYQIVERHGSVLVESIFKGSNRLQGFLVKPSPEEAALLPVSESRDQFVARVNAFDVDWFRIAIIGEYDSEAAFIYPDQKGDLLIELIDNRQNRITLFDRKADGYNAFIDNSNPVARQSAQTQFFSTTVYKVFVCYHYGFEDTEYEDLLEGLDVIGLPKPLDRLNDLFTFVSFYTIDPENKLTELTSVETA